MANNNSEIARIILQIEQEYQASRLGLEGYASGTARHDFIQKRTENIEQFHEQLTALLGPEQAIALIANTIWKPIDQGVASLTNAQAP